MYPNIQSNINTYIIYEIVQNEESDEYSHCCSSPLSHMINKMRLGSHDQEDDIFTSGTAETTSKLSEVPARKKSTKRRSSLTALRKDSCKVS